MDELLAFLQLMDHLATEFLASHKSLRAAVERLSGFVSATRVGEGGRSTFQRTSLRSPRGDRSAVNDDFLAQTPPARSRNSRRTA